MKGGLGSCFKTTGREGGILSLKLPHPLFSVVMGLMTVGPPAYSDHLLILEQGLANWPAGQIWPYACFCKFVLEHSLACLFTYCLWLLWG